jgi:hypothetical protein
MTVRIRFMSLFNKKNEQKNNKEKKGNNQTKNNYINDIDSYIYVYIEPIKTVTEKWRIIKRAVRVTDIMPLIMTKMYEWFSR